METPPAGRPEQALSEVESRFRAVFEYAPVGMVVIEPGGRFLHVNRAFCSITGYPAAELLAPGIDFRSLTHPDDLGATQEGVAGLLAGELPSFSQEKRYVRKDGSAIWVRTSISLRQADGGAGQIIGLVEDISARKAAEQAAHESAERLRLATDAAQIGILEWDDHSDMPVWENEQMYRLFGRAREAGPIGRAEFIARIVHPDDLDDFRTALRTAERDGRPFYGEFRIRRPDGAVRWLSFSGDAELGTDGTTRHLRGVIADVTERRHHADLHRSERAFRTLAEHSPDLIDRYDRQLHHVFVNPAFAQYMGRPVEEILGRSNRAIGLPEPQATMLDQAVQAVFDQAREQHLEFMLPGPGGERYLDKRLVPERGDDGRVATVLVVTRDLTERHRAEAERARLTAALKESYRCLQEAHQELEGRNEDLEQFASVVSHDLRAPLRAVHALAATLAEEEDERLSPGGSRLLRLLQERIARMDALVTGLLDYARASTRPAQREHVCVAELARELVAFSAPPQALAIEIDASMPCFETDRLGLQQVLGNLVENAVKYHERAEGHVRIAATDRGECYEFEVSDDGPGIPEEHQQTIFGMFQRGPHQNDPTGTGIGLAVVQRTVERLGGRIELQSAPGQGATFRFTWPKTLR